MRLLISSGRPINRVAREPGICAWNLRDWRRVLQHDPNRPEDVLKVDADEDGVGGDEAADALRYRWRPGRARSRPGGCGG